MQPPCTPHRLHVVTVSSLFKLAYVAGVQQVTFTDLVISFVDPLLRKEPGLPCPFETQEQHYGQAP